MATESALLPSGETLLLKTNFEVADKLDTFYSGGDVTFSDDGGHLFCSLTNGFAVVNTQTGRAAAVIEEEEDYLSALAVSKDGKLLMSAWKSSLIRQYDWEQKSCLRQWKAHNSQVVTTMDFDSTSTLLASGASDGSVKVWDCYKQFCTHNFNGSGGVVSFVRFHPISELSLLFSSSMDYSVRQWDLKTSRCQRVLSGHVSPVTDMCFDHSGKYFTSCGRDQVLFVWELGKTQPVKTVATFESVEGVVTLPQGTALTSLPEEGRPGFTVSESDFVVATAGEKGTLRIWDARKGVCLHTLPPVNAVAGEESEEGNPNAFMGLRLQQTLKSVIASTADHNLVAFSLEDFSVTKQFIGNNDEILDVRFAGKEEEYIAMATNSSLVKVFDCKTFGCQLLSGHTDIVLSLDVSTCGEMLVTGSKDNTLRVWRASDSGRFVAVAVGRGHTHSVGAVAMSKQKRSFAVSGSTDRTLKMWSLKSVKHVTDQEDVLHLPVKFTQIAHDKDINSIDVAPNNKLIVTGSQDKTAKLWSPEDGAALGVMRGHRRGLWSVRFSPVDQCVATSSADGTVKLWAIADCSCVKSFEGHSSSVLKVVFCTRGMQLISSGGDGLVKVWNIKNCHCAATLNNHDDKVWCLAMSKDDSTLLSGGADSRLCLWKDVTATVRDEMKQKRDEIVVKEQELSNLLQKEQFSEAVGIAITLNQPRRVYNILQKILEASGPEGTFKSTICSLREDQMVSVLNFVKKWNMNSKFSEVAQLVLKVIFTSRTVEDLVGIPNIKENIDGQISYTERYFRRLSKLQQLASFVEYMWECMKLPSTGEPTAAVPTDVGTPILSGIGPSSSEVISQAALQPSGVSEDHSLARAQTESLPSTQVVSFLPKKKKARRNPSGTVEDDSKAEGMADEEDEMEQGTKSSEDSQDVIPEKKTGKRSKEGKRVKAMKKESADEQGQEEMDCEELEVLSKPKKRVKSRIAKAAENIVLPKRKERVRKVREQEREVKEGEMDVGDMDPPLWVVDKTPSTVVLDSEGEEKDFQSESPARTPSSFKKFREKKRHLFKTPVQKRSQAYVRRTKSLTKTV